MSMCNFQQLPLNSAQAHQSIVLVLDTEVWRWLGPCASTLNSMENLKVGMSAWNH